MLLNRPLPLGASGPSPPERNVHPLPTEIPHAGIERLRSLDGSIDIIEQPVDALEPASTLVHVFPPSVVL